MQSLSRSVTELTSLLAEWCKTERPLQNESIQSFRQRIFSLLENPEQISMTRYPGMKNIQKLLLNTEVVDAYREQYRAKSVGIIQLLGRDLSLFPEGRIRNAKHRITEHRVETALSSSSDIAYWQKLETKRLNDDLKDNTAILGDVSKESISLGGILSEKFPALQYRLRKLRSYSQEYRKTGYISTPSRQSYEDIMTDCILNGSSILLTGETGTGKTVIAKRVMKSLDRQKKGVLRSIKGLDLQMSGERFAHAIKEHPELIDQLNGLIDQAKNFFQTNLGGTYEQFLDSISVSLNEISGHSGMTVGELTAKSSIRPSGDHGAMEMITILGPVLRGALEGRPVLIDEIDLIPTDTIMRIKSLMTARSNDSYTPQEGLGKRYKVQGMQIIATRNGKSARHDRVEMDPAIERLFSKKIHIAYPGIQEQYDMILAELIDPVTGTISGVTERELSDHTGILYIFLRAVELIREDYTMWDYADGIDEKSKRIKNAVIDPGIITDWIRGFKSENDRSLTEYLKDRSIEWFSNAPSHDQVNIAKIFTQFGLIYAGDFAVIKSKLLGVSNVSLSTKNTILINDTLKKWGFQDITEKMLYLPGSSDIFFVDPYAVANLDPFDTFGFENKIVKNDDQKLLEYILSECSGVFSEDDTSIAKKLVLSLVEAPEKITTITPEEIDIIDQYLENNLPSARTGLYNFSKTKELKKNTGSNIDASKNIQYPFLLESKETYKKIMFQRMREEGVNDPLIAQESSIIKALDRCKIDTLSDILVTLPVSNKKLSKFTGMFADPEKTKALTFYTNEGEKHVWLFGVNVSEDIGKPVPKSTIQTYIISLPDVGSYGSYQGWQQLLKADFTENTISAGDIKKLIETFAGDQTIVRQLLSELFPQTSYYNPNTKSLKSTNDQREFWLSDDLSKTDTAYLSIASDTMEIKKGGKFMGRPIILKIC